LHQSLVLSYNILSAKGIRPAGPASEVLEMTTRVRAGTIFVEGDNTGSISTEEKMGPVKRLLKIIDFGDYKFG